MTEDKKIVVADDIVIASMYRVRMADRKDNVVKKETGKPCYAPWERYCSGAAAQCGIELRGDEESKDEFFARVHTVVKGLHHATYSKLYKKYEDGKATKTERQLVVVRRFVDEGIFYSPCKTKDPADDMPSWDVFVGILFDTKSDDKK